MQSIASHRQPKIKVENTKTYLLINFLLNGFCDTIYHTSGCALGNPSVSSSSGTCKISRRALERVDPRIRVSWKTRRHGDGRSKSKWICKKGGLDHGRICGVEKTRSIEVGREWWKPAERVMIELGKKWVEQLERVSKSKARRWMNWKRRAKKWIVERILRVRLWTAVVCTVGTSGSTVWYSFGWRPNTIEIIKLLKCTSQAHNNIRWIRSVPSACWNHSGLVERSVYTVHYWSS